MRPLLAFFLCPALLCAADPDWPKLEAESLALLQRYVRIPSINPPADTRAAAELYRQQLETGGFEVTLFHPMNDGRTNVLTRLPGRDRTKKPLLLLNHLDVVPVDRAAWPMDPFSAEIRDGYIWGRGTLDMKGVGVMQLMALIEMKRLGIVPARDIVLLATCDEETNGEYGIQWMIDHHAKEIDAEYVLDEGGFGSRDVLSTGKLVFGVSVGEKQTTWVRLHAKGTAAHGSQPIPDNANMTLLAAIQKALDAPAGAKPHPVVEEMKANIGAFAENKFTNALQRNTASLTTLRAGVGDPPKVNVIPSASEATIDCRLLPGVNAEEFVSDMRARINDPRVTVELLSKPLDPGASNYHTPLFAALRAAILRQHPAATVTPMLVPYGTDSAKMRLRGVTAYGILPMVLPAAILATMHSDQERIPVAEFQQGLHIMFDVLRSEF